MRPSAATGTRRCRRRRRRSRNRGEPQREMTILEVLVSSMVFGTNGKGAIGAKAFVTVTTDGAAGLIVAVGEPRCACRRCHRAHD